MTRSQISKLLDRQAETYLTSPRLMRTVPKLVMSISIRRQITNINGLWYDVSGGNAIVYADTDGNTSTNAR